MKKSRYIIPLLFLCQITIWGSTAHAAEPNWYAKGLQAEYAGDYQTAIANYTKSANSGLSDASYAIGRIYKMLGDDASSLKWFLKAANARNKFAQYEVGLIYLNGSSSTVADSNEALKWFTSSANAGLGEAAYELFKFDENAKWLKIAAEQGVKEAIKDLANAYEQGMYGLEVDVNKSKVWAQQLIESQEQGAAQ